MIETVKTLRRLRAFARLGFTGTATIGLFLLTTLTYFFIVHYLQPPKLCYSHLHVPDYLNLKGISKKINIVEGYNDFPKTSKSNKDP